MVDPIAEQVMVLTRVDGMYEEAVFRSDDRILSTLFPEVQLTAAQVVHAKIESADPAT